MYQIDGIIVAYAFGRPVNPTGALGSRMLAVDTLNAAIAHREEDAHLEALVATLRGEPLEFDEPFAGDDFDYYDEQAYAQAIAREQTFERVRLQERELIDIWADGRGAGDIAESLAYVKADIHALRTSLTLGEAELTPEREEYGVRLDARLDAMRTRMIDAHDYNPFIHS
jgi:hypothetical protein